MQDRALVSDCAVSVLKIMSVLRVLATRFGAARG
jgi:hypothetical protein